MGCRGCGGSGSCGSHENVHRVRHDDPVRGALLACLGLTARNDTPADITRAYRSLARVLHPDKCTATRRFQALHAAYGSLLSSS